MDNETPLDPFAVDFFGVRAPVPEDEGEEISISQEAVRKKIAKPKKHSEWFAKIPKFSRQEAEFSNTLQNLPVALTENIAAQIGAILAHYTFTEPGSVHCSIISTSEINLGGAAAQLAKSPQVFLTLGCPPKKDTAIISLDTDFASSVINLTLGGKGADITPLKKLSAIEQTILEFLSVSILSEINELTGRTLFCLQNFSETAPHIFASHTRGLEMVLRVDFQAFSGIITLLASKDFLNMINRHQNDFSSKNLQRGKFAGLVKAAPSVDLRMFVGRTTLEADNLSFLEPGDVILIEKPEFRQLKNLSEPRQFFAGSGTNVRFGGNFIDDVLNAGTNFQIKEFTSEATRRVLPFTKFTMDVNENEFSDRTEFGENNSSEETGADYAENNSPEDLSALENVQVNLRVEIAGDKLSLHELQNFRAGQIIALGCRPTDPVRLVTDDNDQPVAIGELVEIEGQLGVRLTKVYI